MKEYLLQRVGTYLDKTDKSVKCVFKNKDGEIIEMSYLCNRQERDVVCVPTHHFCTMGCTICHLTQFKSSRQMKRICIDEFNEALERTLSDDSGKRISTNENLLISYMGVGEPMMNIELLRDVRLTDIARKNLGYVNVSYAMASMIPSVEKFNELVDMIAKYEVPMKLHFSMHDTDDKQRKSIIPSSQCSVDEVLNMLDDYANWLRNSAPKTITEMISKFHHSPIEVHYTLIDEVNDSVANLNTMANMLATHCFTLKFIDFNEGDGMKKSERLDIWLKRLYKEVGRQRIKTYCPPGKSIGSSCGEFTKHFYVDEESESDRIEFVKWSDEHLIRY